MATMLSKVREMTKSTTSITSDVAIVNFLNYGARESVLNIPKSLLWFLVSAGADITNDSGQTCNIDMVHEVYRNSILCDRIPTEALYQAGYTGSLEKATAMFPKYAYSKRSIFIKPAPSGTAVGVVYKVNPPTITISTNDSGNNWDNIQNIILDFASALDCMAVGSYYAQLETDIDLSEATDALDKARDLIDNSTGMSQGDDAEAYIAKEDTEMVDSVVKTAAQEVNRAIATLQQFQSGKSQYVAIAQDYFNKSAMYFKEARTKISSYISNNEQMIKLGMMQRAQNEST